MVTCPGSGRASAQDREPTVPIIDRFAQMHQEMTAWRRDIHAHPELGFREHRTADLVAEKLESWGIEVHRGVGGTGVVGVLRAGDGGDAVGLRADMDALPIQEANTFDHHSRHDGVMHACGHDGHTAMLLGAARYLAETRNFRGTVNFIFQPAEEGLGGASAMIDDGLFDRFPCDNIFGMHNRPGLPLGQFAVRGGPMMAGGASFDVDITGKGAHGARPERGIDPVIVAAHITTALQTIVARNASPLDSAVLSVTQIHAGDAYNVIPQTARLSGTARAFSRATMDLMAAGTQRIARGVAEGLGATAVTRFDVAFAPTINDVAAADFAAGVCAEVAGADKVDRDPPLIMASEDFSFMLEKVPGCYFNVGNGHGADGEICDVHNPGYDFNDDAMPFGASVFARVVEKRLPA
ncbi:MAG: amidohydrolase [Hyphomicrobiales bacterium]|nr:amidohydrolase [Hyphomicrobiales bacterium]MCP5373279.1 amidohydrolase [Hyphomicrobiales bacterium]